MIPKQLPELIIKYITTSFSYDTHIYIYLTYPMFVNFRKCLPFVDACTLPKVTGPCFAAHRRWYANNGECEEFIYGGCRGNLNNFPTREACEAACGRQ